MKNSENIISELNLLMLNVPDNLTPIEKVRWIYIKAGELFSYDYNLENINAEIRYDADYIDRYQSCIQISNILNLMFNNIDPENISCEVVERRLSLRGDYNHEHLANIITLSTGEKFLIDLTLDLYLIQSGCKTKEFGFSTLYGDESIISLQDCELMDKKLGLIKNGEYTDKKISDTKSRIYSNNFKGMSLEDIVSIKIEEINKIMFNFKGYQEGKNYINKLFYELLKHQYKEYNLKYQDGQMISCFEIFDENEQVWYLYNSMLGLVKTDPVKIINMLNSGWNSKSLSLDEQLTQEKKTI